MSDSRKNSIAKLKEVALWDVAVIGGGASGLGIALDAASRGYKTVLFERYDFAKGTSSKSTKLVHGGVRYLQQGNIKLVREALYERGLLAKNAGHLFKRQEFIIPSYNWWGGYFYTLGLKLYDLLSGQYSIGSSKLISKKATLKRIPTLKEEGLQSGVSYFDGQFDDSRLAINIAQTAQDNGAVVLNYAKVVGFNCSEDQTIKSLEILEKENRETFSVKSKVVINATGIFTDKIVKLQKPEHKKTVVPSQGIHLVLDATFLNSNRAIMVPKTSDGRVLFIIPWHGKVLAGTTDTLIKKPSIEPVALEEEVAFILETAKEYLTRPPSREDVLSVYSGLRPLAKPSKDSTNTKEVSRSHKIIIHKNLVSIVGGKWTTYRRMAQDVTDQLSEKFNLATVECKTQDIAIFGNIDQATSTIEQRLERYGSSAKTIKQWEQENESLQTKLHPNYPFTIGELHWSVKNEFALNVEDILARRLRLLFLDAKAALEAAPIVAKEMAAILEKDQNWIDNQLVAFRELANNYILDA